MLKKLRLKIILAIVLVAAVMLGAILGLFYTLTKQNLRTQSISMMQAIAADPFAPVQPEREPQQVRLPYFVLQTDAFGNLVAIGSSDYDLTDRTFLRMVGRCGAGLTGRHRRDPGIQPALLPRDRQRDLCGHFQ